MNSPNNPNSVDPANDSPEIMIKIRKKGFFLEVVCAILLVSGIVGLLLTFDAF